MSDDGFSDFASEESSSDDELEFMQDSKVKNEDYLETTVPHYSDETFFEHFRVSRNVANEISGMFQNSDYRSKSGPFGKLLSGDQMQAVCDHQRRFRDLFVGYLGSVHDSRVFRTSPLSQTLEQNCGTYFILGNNRYPLQKNLLTPYKDRATLTEQEINYNIKLSKNRCIIENSFGMLKQKFRQLNHIKLREIL
ncbi:unnamed protein product [Acanthoscelides obtectus]|uniref:DDE Tnp4 domain-containing protein n=1 Tax=Acanthoscelides obtectus TaxID=200917 RepID=A0A9P0LE06_ACAOB|nr:unnamed protein product [Acanthoscelides obtectus]CAK1640661.1 Putative nuclease HARBI1 [Acanthoscelides obtectus]